MDVCIGIGEDMEMACCDGVALVNGDIMQQSYIWLTS